jgi:GTPase SAR1 family protein
VRGTFDPASKVTVGAAYVGHALTLADGRAAKLEIWDTAGQER